MKFSPERRQLLKTGLVVASTLLRLPIADVLAQTEKPNGRKPVACTFHGINGNPHSGIIGGLNSTLSLIGYDVYSPQLSGEGNPQKDVHDYEVATLLDQVNPDITFWHSLAGRIMLRLGTKGQNPMGIAVSISIRKPDVDPTQFGINDPRRAYYTGGVDVERYVQHVTDGRYVVHSEGDNSVDLKENAYPLAKAIKAHGTYFNVGREHYDRADKSVEDAQDLIVVGKDWGIIRAINQ